MKNEKDVAKKTLEPTFLHPIVKESLELQVRTISQERDQLIKRLKE